MDGVIDIPIPAPKIPVGDGNRGPESPSLGLEEFVAGEENRSVEVLIRATLDDKSASYNPIVLFGPSGTGKSHLARGLITPWKATHRRTRVITTTAADFARELADAIETQAIDDFRRRYRRVNLLVLEDVAELADKPAAQEELAQTLDALVSEQRQVVATARVAPGQLAELSVRLRSRLEAGLAVPLVRPGSQTRRVVLRRLAQRRDIELIDAAAGVLAEGLNVTVPELCGALLQLEMPARLAGGVIDADAARRYLCDRRALRQPSLREIASATAKSFSLKLSDLRSPSRRRAVVLARGVAMYLARRLTDNNYQQIGRYFSGRDHTTVMYGCRRTESLLKTDAAMREAVERLQQKWSPEEAPVM